MTTQRGFTIGKTPAAAGVVLAKRGFAERVYEASGKLGGCCANTRIDGYTFHDRRAGTRASAAHRRSARARPAAVLRRHAPVRGVAVWAVASRRSRRSVHPPNPIPGLFQTGQTTYPGYGVNPAILSGILAAENIIAGQNRRLW